MGTNACCTSDKGLMSGVYKELIKLNIKKNNNLIFKKMNPNGEFTKEEIQMTKTIFKCSKSLAI